MTNQNGKPWDGFDAERLMYYAEQITKGEPFVVVAEDGTRLCGKHEAGKTPVTLTAVGWRT